MPPGPPEAPLVCGVCAECLQSESQCIQQKRSDSTPAP